MGALGARTQLQNCHLPLGAFVFTALPMGTEPAILSSQQENFLEVLMQEAMVIQSLFTSQRKGFTLLFTLPEWLTNYLGAFFLLELA